MKILLIDGNNYVHRGFWAVKDLANSKGVPTNAIKGTLNIVMADIEHLQPDRVVVVFDKGGKPNWRTLEYPMYKRSPARVASKESDKGREVFEQFKPIRILLKAMGLKLLGIAGVEADDLIGTLATQFEAMGHTVLVSSNDKDFGSIVTKNVNLVEARTRELLDPVAIKVKYGVKPSQMIEYLMLLGDGVDNIPGIPKCGPGTARKWLSTYGDIKTLLLNTNDLTPVLKANLKSHKKVFKWTRRLITLHKEIPHKITIDNCGYGTPDLEKLKRMCDKYELKETHKQILKMLKSLPEPGAESTWTTANNKETTTTNTMVKTGRKKLK